MSITVDNVPITDDTDFEAVALDALRGRGGSFPSDNGPIDWVYRAYKQLAATAYAGRLSQGVAACLTAEPEVREQALLFFITYPRAAGAERVTQLAVTSGLDSRLAEALAARITVGDEDALLRGQLEVLKPGNGGVVIASLTRAAPDWVVGRAEEITRLAPAAGATILIQLQHTGHDVLAVARRIVPLCHDDTRFELDIPRFIDDPATRQAILDLF
jgi:hypothetical protein